MRTSVEDRYYKTYTYQKVDRVPDIEFGYWTQTIRRWLKEGMQIELSPKEQNDEFLVKLDDFLGLERNNWDVINLRIGMDPVFKEEILERKTASVIMRDATGSLAERYLKDADESSIPHFIKFPVETPEDWKSMKERYNLDSPSRAIPQAEIDRLRISAAEGKMISARCPGPYGVLRSWIGFENLSIAFYDSPQMIHEMVEHITELTLRQIRKLPEDLPIDHASWWEDMAGKNGPFVGPKMFREFLQPAYHAIMCELRRHGCVISTIDSDGNPYNIVRNWLDEGVNIMFPLEVMAGVDPYAWRREFGLELRLRGGIAKAPLVEGGSAIDRELERIKPLLDQGGYIPHLDHLVPPDIPYNNYCEYLEKKRKLIGK